MSTTALTAVPSHDQSFNSQSLTASTTSLPILCSCTSLPLSLLGRCFRFLNLKELHASHTVSHIFYEVSHDPSVWQENSTLPSSFHYSTFSSPRIQLRSSTPLVQLAAIRSSPKSFGHLMRWLEVRGEIRELNDMVQLIGQESTKLDGLIIRQTIRNWSQSVESMHLTSFICPSNQCFTMRTLVIGGVQEAFMTAILPTIATISSLEILEFELMINQSGSFNLPVSVTTFLSLLKNLRTFILSDPIYRRRLNRLGPSDRVIFLSNTSLSVLKTLVSSAPQITRIELCCCLAFCSNSKISPSTQLPQVATVAMNFCMDLPRLFHLFPCLTCLIDGTFGSAPTNANFFLPLPATITEITIAELHLRVTQSVRTSLLPLRRLTIQRLVCSNRTLGHILGASLSQVEEFHCHAMDTISQEYFMDLIQLMPHLLKCTMPWPSTFERDLTHPASNTDLKGIFATRFLELRQLRIVAHRWAGRFRSAYDARELLRVIPQLKEVKWNNEPWLSIDQLESYYSWESIQHRMKQRLNFNQLDHIRPILQQINSSSLPNSVNLNLLSLTLIFQFLTPHDLFSTHRVCRSYRVAAVSPLVLRPNIRVRIDVEKGVIVSGTQVSFTSIKPMLSAVRSMLFQNIRILTLPPPLESAIQTLPRQPDFYAYHLDRFELIPYFHSLHTLALDWSFSPSELPPPSVTVQDEILIDRIFQSPTLKHLKVLKLKMCPVLMELMFTQWVVYLSELELIEIRVVGFTTSTVHREEDILMMSQLSQLSSLKRVYIDYGHFYTNRNDLLQLHELRRLSQSIESIHWCPFLDEELVHSVAHDPPIVCSSLHSVRVKLSRIDQSSSVLDMLDRSFPSLTTIRLVIHGTVPDSALDVRHSPITIPTRFHQELVAIEIHCADRKSILSLLNILNTVHQWSRLERFELFGSDSPDPDSRVLIPMDQLTTILRSMRQLTDLALEGVKFSMDLDPHPWIGRLHRFQHSNRRQLIRLLPLAHQLIQFRTRLNFPPPLDLLPSLLVPSRLTDVYFRSEHYSRQELIQHTATRSKPAQPPPHEPPTPASIATNAYVSPSPSTAISHQPPPDSVSSLTTHSSLSGVAIIVPSDLSPPVADPTADPPPESESSDLAAILMELVESFRSN